MSCILLPINLYITTWNLMQILIHNLVFLILRFQNTRTKLKRPLNTEKWKIILIYLWKKKLLVVNFLSRLGCDTWPALGLMWHTLHRAARTLDKSLAEQSSLKNGRPVLLPSIHQQIVHTRPIYDWSAGNIKCASPDDHHKKAWSSLIV